MGSEFQPKPHVVVVGAGIVGASIAWHLATDPSGPDVTIVAEEVGGTATPCSFAWLNASWHNPRFYYDFRRRSIAGWRRLEDEVPGLRELVRWSGSLSVSESFLPLVCPLVSSMSVESGWCHRDLILLSGRDDQPWTKTWPYDQLCDDLPLGDELLPYFIMCHTVYTAF